MQTPNLHSRRVLFTCCILALLAFPLVVMADVAVTIQVSPNVLNLQNCGEVVTIHTDIAYSQVASSTVTLNGVPIFYSKSDNNGFFVAKFTMEDIKNLPLNIGEYNTMTLAGVTVNNEPFTGSKAIMVVNNIPKGK